MLNQDIFTFKENISEREYVKYEPTYEPTTIDNYSDFRTEVESSEHRINNAMIPFLSLVKAFNNGENIQMDDIMSSTLLVSVTVKKEINYINSKNPGSEISLKYQYLNILKRLNDALINFLQAGIEWRQGDLAKAKSDFILSIPELSEAYKEFLNFELL